MRFVLTEKAVRGTVKTLLVAVTLLAVGIIISPIVTGLITSSMHEGFMHVESNRDTIEALLWILFQALPPALYWLLFRCIIQARSSEWQRLGMLIISVLFVGFYSIGYLEWIGSIDSKRDLVFFMWPTFALFVVGFMAAVYFVLSKFRNL